MRRALVFESEAKGRFALDIENKRNASFLKGQAEAYKIRAQHMMGKDRWLNYADFETILICPATYRAINQVHSDFFDAFISYEDVGAFIDMFKPSLLFGNR